MSIVGVIVIFFVCWWLSFLLVLPTDVQSRWEVEDDGVEGADPGAPVSPGIGKKMRRATLLAAVMTAVVVAVILSGVFNFRE